MPEHIELEDHALSPDDYRAAILHALQETNRHLETIARALRGEFDD
jgi:hypothetical protein